jgi:hypothetical protein
MRGSILVTFNELVNDRGIDSFEVLVNGVIRDTHFTDINNYYTTFCFVGDVVLIRVNFSDSSPIFNLERKDFTTDDEGGDKGIKEISQAFTSAIVSPTQHTITFTATTRPDAYDFYYVVDISTLTPTPTPTSTPTPTITPTPTPTPTPTNEARFLLVESNYYERDCFACDPELTAIVRKSDDRGVTFTTVTGTTNLTGTQVYYPELFLSSGGTIQFFTDDGLGILYQDMGGYFYKSSNFGSTFSPVTSFLSGETRSRNYRSIDGSHNGRYVAMAKDFDGYAPLYYSTDSGSTFSFITNSVKNWRYVAVPDNSFLPLYACTDYELYRLDSLSGPFVQMTGLTVDNQSPFTFPISDIAVSENRQYIFVVQPYSQSNGIFPQEEYGGIYVSSNSGNTFTLFSATEPIINYQWENPKISISGNGQKVVIYSNNAAGHRTLYSENYGSTWSLVSYGALLVEDNFISLSDSAQYSYKSLIYNDSRNKSEFLSCNNFLSGCTTLHSYQASFLTPGYFYYNNSQNKEYFGVSPTYTTPSTPSTPTYGPYTAKIDVVFNYSGVTNGDVNINSLYGVIPIPGGGGIVRYPCVDDLSNLIFTGTTGSVTMSPSLFINNPNQIGSHLYSNNYFLMDVQNNNTGITWTSYIQRVYKNNTLIFTTSGSNFISGSIRYFDLSGNTWSQGDTFRFEFDLIFT